MKKPFLECGKIVSTHGIKGEVKLQHWCDSPDFLLQFPVLYLSQGETPLQVEQARVHKGMVMLKLKGYDTIDQAASLRGKVLYLDRQDAPEDEDSHYIQDLLGMEVRDADTGALYGSLTDVFATGANDVYEVTGEDGVKRLIPAIRDVVVELDLEAGLLRIRPLEGLFDDAD